MATIEQAQPAKRPVYQKVLVMAGLMTLVGGTLTGIMTYMNVGLTDTFIADWLLSFALAVFVMMPIGFGLMALIGKLVQLGLPNSKKVVQQLATGVLMALSMESLLATSTTASAIGLVDRAAFVSAWQQAFLAALPFGLCMAVVMSLFLKPRLETFMAS